MIQLNTLEDRSVSDKHQWDTAAKFLEDSLQSKLSLNEANLREQVGPGFYERWFQWQSISEDQRTKAATRSELERILSSCPDHKSQLGYEELTTVSFRERKKNIRTTKWVAVAPVFANPRTRRNCDIIIIFFADKTQSPDERRRRGQRIDPGDLAPDLPETLPEEGFVQVLRLQTWLLYVQPRAGN